MALYLLTFNDNLGSRDQITVHLNKNSHVISDWYYCFLNAIFIASSLNAEQLRDLVNSIRVSPDARFFISEVKGYPAYDGWLPKNAWDFISKYAQR